MMKAIVVEKIGSFAMRERPCPKPGPGEVLLKVEVTGLCRTDLKIIEAGHRDLVLPRIPGEEVVGRICALGPYVQGFRENERVYVYPGTSCGECPPCRAGAGNLCRKMQIMGFHRDGGFAEFVLAPAGSLIAVPDGLSAEQAVFAEPLSCCLNAIELSRLGTSESIGIWGGGPAGVLLSRVALAKGAQPTIIEPNPRRRAFSNGVAAIDNEAKFDVAIVAVGDKAAYAEAITHLRPRGRLVVFSGLPKEDCTPDIDLNQLHYLEQTLVGAYGCSFRHGVEALILLAEKRLAVQDMISHRLPLRELAEGLRLVAEKISMKVLLYP